jgi:hypothetical protein
MQNYIDLFMLLTFSSVAVIAGLQEVINKAKCIADIHKKLPLIDAKSNFLYSEIVKFQL